MTLTDQIKKDVANILLNEDDFAESIDFIAAGTTGPMAISALVLRGSLALTPMDRGRTPTWQITVWVSVAQVPVLVLREDTFVIAPLRGETPRNYTSAIDLTPPHTTHMRRLGLIRS